MAWTVQRQWVNPPAYNETPSGAGPHRATVICSLTSDGVANASAQQMVDISVLNNVNGTTATAVSIERITYTSNVESIELLFDRTTDQSIGIVPAGDNWQWFDPPLSDRGTGGTGDIVFTTTGAAATSKARIEITFRVR